MPELILIAFCLVLNAILSCIEMSFITVSKAHLKKLSESSHLSAKRILTLKANQERTLSVLQLSITLVSTLTAFAGGYAAIKLLSPLLMTQLNISTEAASAVSLLVIILPLSYVGVVFSELVPKFIGLKFPLRVAMTTALFLVFLDKLLYPFVFILESSAKFITSLMFVDFKSEQNVNTSGNVNLENLTETHKQYIFNLINVDKRTVKDVMLPWEQATTIYIHAHQHEILEKIKNARHTRMPVINENDTVVGLLHAKEFVSESEIAKLDWNQLIRPIPTLNSKDSILSALKKLQNKKSHLAIIKEDDKVIGIVTMEDIFEEVVGEIYDEDDELNTHLSVNSRIRTMGLKK